LEREEINITLEENPMPVDVVVHSKRPSALQQEITIGSHRLDSDELRDLGGEDRGPSPMELMAAALGSCTSMTVILYAQRKKWPLERVSVHVESDAPPGQALTSLVLEVSFEGNLDPEQRARLLEIAHKCPVHKTLTTGVQIETKTVEKIA
jgi:putative redox protein